MITKKLFKSYAKTFLMVLFAFVLLASIIDVAVAINGCADKETSYCGTGSGEFTLTCDSGCYIDKIEATGGYKRSYTNCRSDKPVYVKEVKVTGSGSTYLYDAGNVNHYVNTGINAEDGYTSAEVNFKSYIGKDGKTYNGGAKCSCDHSNQLKITCNKIEQIECKPVNIAILYDTSWSQGARQGDEAGIITDDHAAIENYIKAKYSDVEVKFYHLDTSYKRQSEIIASSKYTWSLNADSAICNSADGCELKNGLYRPKASTEAWGLGIRDVINNYGWDANSNKIILFVTDNCPLGGVAGGTCPTGANTNVVNSINALAKQEGVILYGLTMTGKGMVVQ